MDSSQADRPGDGRGAGAPAAGPAAEEVASRSGDRLTWQHRGSYPLERIAQLASHLTGASAGQIALMDDVQTVLAGAGLARGDVGGQRPVEETVCALVTAAAAPLVVSDAAGDARVAEVPAVRQGLVGAYLGVPLKSSDGRAVGTLCVYDTVAHAWSGSDLALLEQLATSVAAELELRALSTAYEEERARRQLAADAAGVGTFDLDVASGQLVWDENLIDLFGYAPGEFDESLRSFEQRLHPDDLPWVSRRLATSIETGTEFRAEYRIQLPGAGVRWVSARGRPLLDASGATVRLLGAAFDTTARIEGEQRAARQLEAATLGFASLDPAGRITHLNARAEELLGLVRQEAAGEVLWEQLPWMVASGLRASAERAARTQRAVTVEVFPPAAGRGADCFEVVLHGTPEGLLLWVTDVSERHRAQQAALRASQRLAVMGEIAVALVDVDEVADLAGVLTEHGRSALGCDGGAVAVHDEDDPDHLLTYVTSTYGPRAQAEFARLPRTTSLPVGVAAVSGRRVLLRDRAASLAFSPLMGAVLDATGSQAFASLPLRADGVAIGVLTVGWDQPQLFDDEQLELLEVFAAQCAQALQRLHARDRERASAREARAAATRLALLSDVGQLLATGHRGAPDDRPAAAPPVEAVDAMALAARLVPDLADWCTIVLVRDGRRGRTSGYAHSDPGMTDLLERYAAVQAASMTERAALAVCLRTGEEVLVPSVPPAAEWSGPPAAHELLSALRADSVAVLPLAAGGRTWGAMALVSTPGRPALGGAELATAREVGRRVGLALDNARLRQRNDLLAAVTDELSATMDPEDGLVALARLVVPELADFALTTIVDPDAPDGGHVVPLPASDRQAHRGLRDVGWWHHDPDQRATLADYAARRIPALRAGSGVSRALSSGQDVHSPTGATAAIQSVLAPGAAHDLIGRLAPSSVSVLPLPGRERTVGLITLWNGADRAPLSAEDLRAAHDVAARAGLALDNARLHSNQRSLAEALQRSLLTTPTHPGDLQVAARYAPAADDVQVGGDWYDVFTHHDGSTHLVIGDVAGHDQNAAAAMSTMRNLLRGITYATASPTPAATLSALDAAAGALAATTASTMATAVLAHLDPHVGGDGPGERGRRLCWSNAGHLPPLVVDPDGSCRYLHSPPDLFLGLDPATRRGDHTTRLDPGALVLLYTDGLVERRGAPLTAGLDWLLGAVADLDAATLTPDELCDALLALIGGHLDDDVALLAVRLVDPPAGAPAAR